MPLWPSSNWPVMLYDRLATDLRPGRDRLKLPVWLDNCLHEIKISRVTCDRFKTVSNDILGHKVNLRPTCKDLEPKEDPAASWVICKWNWQVPRPFLTVKSGRGACRFQWRVGLSHCEYSAITYDLLVSNIGGTYGLADQFPSKHEFGHF